MLKLTSVKKEYKVADTKVMALRGISLSFRNNEFVSVLGPSGCGKTTLLNIIGGLDKYTTGDLFIGGRSTKEFKDKDWDIYRNHRVGFVFQSYNLIPHQTVLGNVELALTIAGLSKRERIAKAKMALDKVGLSDQYYKYPNQLSGGQGQRVAIARALVNDPDILLADEPTGALDTTTSVQIMELVKEISNERLVIMVTHNSDLAEKYSTRIIKLLDGELQDDTNPCTETDSIKNANDGKASSKLRERAKMSLWTAFLLSLKNLLTKKARTTMIGIAGSIGIIGVSLVLSISYGVEAFIEQMQNDMLSGNPVEIRESGVDLVSLMRTARRTEQATALREYGYVNVDLMIEYLASRASTADNIMLNNNITQEYIDYILTLPDEYVAAIFFNYGLDVTNNIFTDFKEAAESEAVNMSLSTIRTIYTSVLEHSPYSAYADFVTSFTDIFEQAPNSGDFILSQYDLVYGRPASEKNEIMLVLERDSMLTDLLLAQLGYFTQEEFLNLVFRAAPEPDGRPNPLYAPALDKLRFSYDELIGRRFTWYPNNDLFIPTGTHHEPFSYNAFFDNMFSDGLELTVVGILEPKESISYGSLQSGIYYTEALTRHIIDSNIDSMIVTALLNNGQSSTSSGVRPSAGLMDGIRTTADGAEQLSDGAAQLSIGVNELVSGAERLKSSASDLTALQDGSRQLNDGAKSLSTALVRYTDSVDQMLNMLSQMVDMSFQMADTSSQMAETLLMTSATLRDAVQENPLLLEDPNIAGLVQALSTSGGGNIVQIADASNQLRGAAQQLHDASSQLRGAAQQLRSAASHLESGTGGLHESMEHLTLLQDGISGLTDGLEVLRNGTESLEEGTRALSEGLADYRTDGENDNQDSAPPISITFQFSYSYLGERFENVTGYLGSSSQFISLAGSLFSSNPQLEELARMKTLTINQLGGVDRANTIRIYPANFEQKALVQEHLDRWNSDEAITFYSASQNKELTLTPEQRDVVRYIDALTLVVGLINNLIEMITFALIGFTSLSLLVSCVMIGIITYVSVVERIKEIGVIRSLGGRKRDVSNLFTAETVIIGLLSGLIGVGITYIGSWVINLIIYAQQDIETIAIFPLRYAGMMVGVSIFLTLVSGFMPSRSAARKDPAVALRTE